MNKTFKAALLWIVVIIFVFLFWSLFQTTKGTVQMMPFSAFLDQVEQGNVRSVVIRGTELRGETRGTTAQPAHEFSTVIPASYPPMYDLMRSKRVNFELEPAREAPVITALITWAPVLFLIGLWVFFMRMMKGRAQQSPRQSPPTPPQGGGP